MAHIIAFLAGGAVAGAVTAFAFLRARRRRGAEDDAARRTHRAEQLATAGSLAGGLIHEIKNPLNTLSLNLQLLAEDWREAESQKERRALKRIRLLQAEADRLASILDDFMGLVRGHPLVPSECDVNKIVDEVIAFVRPELESNRIEIRSSCGPLPPSRLDANLMKQALLNLILNAEQAMSDDHPREIIIRTAPEDDSVRIDVIDTGRGIPVENVEKIFDAFYSTRKGGTGLGLSTTRRIVEEHGGRITVHSDQGRGTCFTVTLPVGGPPEVLHQRGGAPGISGGTSHG